MDLQTLMLILTATSLLIAVALWLPIARTSRIRRTEVYLSGEPQSQFRIGLVEVAWAVRYTMQRLYRALVEYVQTGLFNDWFAFSLPYLLLLAVLLYIALGG
ncbi:MAG: hypothetical protein LM571_00005 [Desulfurococcaceae archaeon]|nr:hypothetical protein [Desulfurococcaceae archaeon]